MELFDLIPGIQKHCLFATVCANTLSKYFNESTMLVRRFISKEIICSPQINTNHIGILISGLAQVHSGSGNETALLKTISPGEIFGIANLYTHRTPFPTVISAKSGCEVLMIEKKAFQQYVETEAEARRAYFSFLSNKIVYLNQKIAIFTAGSAEKRLAFFLLENEENLRWTVHCSMSALANMLNIGRASLYRAMDSLIASGLILRADKEIQIQSRSALKEFLSKDADSAVSCLSDVPPKIV